jgi:arylsulfatase A-like enzyme
MQSRISIPALFAVLLTLIAPALRPTADAADAKKRPNVLFIAVDDLNDWIGCLGGHPQSRTPNIDRLAARGVLFEKAYCAAPACNPSRAALLTGIRPSTSGVYSNSQPWRPVMPDVVTLPQHFMQHGYRVVGGGKIFHGGFNDDASWQEYFNKSADPKPDNLPVNGIPGTAHFDWGPVQVEDQQMDDHRVVSWAVEELGKEQDKPLFLACGIFRPHLPWYVPQKYFDQYPVDSVELPKILESDLDDVPPAGVKMAKPQGDDRKVRESNNHYRAVQGYLASIAFADKQVGRLLDALDNGPLADNTIVILWGDHGWHLGEKHHWRKFALWEEATQAPLMLTVPGVTKPGGRSPRPVSFMDVYPTLADLCGLPIGDHLEGETLRPLLENPQAAWDRPALCTHGRNNHALRSERWRYIRYADGSEELYDHQADPMEWKNLADDQQYAAVKKELAAWLPKKNAPNAPRKGDKPKRRK